MNCLACEATKNGFGNFIGDGYARILPALLPVRYRINTPTSLAATRHRHRLLRPVRRNGPAPQTLLRGGDGRPRRTVQVPRGGGRGSGGRPHPPATLADAEAYFAKREEERRAKLCRHDETLRVEFDAVAFTGREELATVEETGREDAGEYDYTDRQARGLLIRKHHPEPKNWGTCALNWARDDYESHYLLISGGLGNEDSRPQRPGVPRLPVAQGCKGKTDWHGMDDEVRETVREWWGRAMRAAARRPRAKKILHTVAEAGLQCVMPNAREATPVTLTEEQRARLENQWFVWGNHGPKATPGNHTFIQTILEHGLDIRPLRNKRTRKSEIPTPECEAVVDRILGQPHVPHERLSLRLVATPTTRCPRLRLDPEVTSMLDSMKRRYRVITADLQDDTPDAA